MQNLPFNRMTSDARSLADSLGAQTTEALIRAVSGVQHSANEGGATVREGVEAVGTQIGQIGQGMAEGVQTMAAPNTSVRLAWRTGRFFGRVEGAVRLASFGVRFWWKRRQHGREGQSPTLPRALTQWGPTAIASVYLAQQLWSRWRNRTAST